MEDPFQSELNNLRARSLHRRLRQMESGADGTVELAGGKLVNFASNDYLGLADDPILRDAAKAAIDQYGVGAGASRLVSGTRPAHTRLEEKLARFKGSEAALSFSSGYAAAAGAISVLADKQDVLILDKLCHASLVDAARASGAVLRVFPHSHLGKLEDHLQWARREYPDARVIVVTEAVFSMDGDRTPLAEIVELKAQHGALLLVDEAHSVGVIGRNGRGLAAELGLEADVDVHLGTLSKALGVSGGYICGKRSLIELLVNRARTFIYSTAPPPALAAAAEAAVDFLASEEGERRRLTLWQNIRLLASQLPPAPDQPEDEPAAPARKDGGSAIFPWIVGGEADAVDYSSWLAKKGFFAPAIRFPTVAKGAARLRVTLCATHTPEQIASLCEALGSLEKRLAQERAENT
jgi:8-amino-7-oxononanoate synthase